MTRKSTTEKPEKPREDYPLTAHASGQWCKRIHGKLYYFGPWEDPEQALDEYERKLPSITGARGDDPSVTVRQMCNLFLASKRVLLSCGDLSQRTWNDYKTVGERLVKHFGPARPIDTLSSQDFEGLRKTLPAAWSYITVNNFVIRVKAILNYAYKEDLVRHPIRVGTVFARSSQKRVRIQRANAPKKFFDASEISTLVSKAPTPQLAAMIMCGINLGYGNADCGRLTQSMLDLETGWVREPRHKTGIWRMGKLWPETIELLRNLKPRKNTPDEFADRVFLTRRGSPYWTDGGHDAIATAFYRLTCDCGLHRKNVGFYSLRHVTQTIGEEAADSIALKILMGHVDTSIAEKYREHFNPDRVEKVSDHIRNWYLANQSPENQNFSERS